jgi:serine/threonine-protein kinase
VVKLTDFGIARSTHAARITGTGLAVGTVAYMSPEQIRAGAIDARSDIYSFGLTFYEMVVGQPAVQGETQHAQMTAQLEAIPPAPAELNPLVPQAVSAAIMRAIAKEPGQRFPSALEFHAALHQGAAGALSPPVPPPLPRPSAISAVELAELETRLARALGPIAKHLVNGASRRYGSVTEIRQALAAQIEDAGQRAEFLKSTTRVGTERPTATLPLSPVSFDPATVDRLAEALTLYLGPIAKVVVNRSARAAQSLEELQNALAAQISSEKDRQRFLAAVRLSA